MAQNSRRKQGGRDAAVRKDARVQRTRQSLREALVSLLEQQAFEAITIRDLTATAGTGYATFFRHYHDTAELLDDVAASGIRELLARALPVLGAADTKASCLALATYIDEHRQLWSVLLTGGARATLREEFIRQARAVASTYPKKKKPRNTLLPTDLAVVFGVSGTLEILGWWLQNRGQFSREGIAIVLDRLVIAPAVQE